VGGAYSQCDRFSHVGLCDVVCFWLCGVTNIPVATILPVSPGYMECCRTWTMDYNTRNKELMIMHTKKIDGRKNPKRIKVAPPPDGKKPGDWLNKDVVSITDIAGHPAGSNATVFVASHGGSGLTIRFSDGTTVGGITDRHIMIPRDA